MATRLTGSGFAEEFVRENESDLKTYVRRKLAETDYTDVDDIVQEAFLRIATHKGGNAVVNPRGFLFRIARNLTFDALRRGKVRRAFAESMSSDYASGAISARSHSAEDEASCREELDRMLHAIDDLPPKCRRVFLLQRQDGLSYGQIAAKLHISESMVQKHMSKALAHLYRVLT